MTSKAPDPFLLDDLVSGVERDRDIEGWIDLVRDPDSANAWRDAIRRRQRTDAFAALVLRHPIVARAARALCRHLRSGAARSLPVEVVRMDLAHGMLAPTDEAPDVSREASPMDDNVIELSLGKTVELRIPGEPTAVWFGVWRDGQGIAHDQMLEHARWRMDPNEAPVLLVAVGGAGTANTLDGALAVGHRLATVLLVEPEA